MAKKIGIETFVAKSNIIHQNKYDYSESRYKGIDKHITVICPEHGAFQIRAGKHIAGTGCQQCPAKLRHTNEQFIRRVKEHFPEYNYSQVNYRGVNSMIDIGCPIHGMFNTKARNLIGGNGCRICAASKPNSPLQSTTALFIQKAKLAHGDKYDYSKVNYTYNDVDVEIICPIHGSFFAKPQNHIGKNAKICKECNIPGGYTRTGFREMCNGRKSYIYLLAIETPHETCLKVGRTVNPNRRYAEIRSDGVTVIPLNIIEFENPDETFDGEIFLLRLFKQYKIITKFQFGGMTECFHNLPQIIEEFQNFKNKSLKVKKGKIKGLLKGKYLLT